MINSEPNTPIPDPDRFSAANDPGELRPDLPRTDMLYITCRNHPDAGYLMKNIHGRSLHFIKPSAIWLAGKPTNLECDCPASDLIYTDNQQQVFPKRG